ncbi:hypothetical protein J2W23_005577 [Variovorax boronicumulans]|uniref:DUF4123 domain-containing protein n=1 Tax=Variovorax boronicumulans TaxID=436515 RepID=UPI0027897A09|nr:DUF4123 domain-containing protein [Variovorax boronicumulans]MDQ0017168.1 hypothetical protein [Variovorax boronicumulans]
MIDTLEQATRISLDLHAQINPRPNADCMLLLDAVPRPITEDDALWERYSQIEQTRVRLSYPNVNPSHFPVLVPLCIAQFEDSVLLEQSAQDAYEELAPEALQSGTGRRISGWLTSRASIATVARHLASVMLQHPSPFGLATWLRLQDPATLWWLWSFLAPTQRSALLGPIETFWLLDPAGRLTALRNDAAGTTSDAPAALQLSPAQWQDIACIGPLNLALREWGQAQAVGERFDKLCMGAHAAVRRAQAAGFNDRRDQAAYARYALEIHPQFDAHALVQARLAGRNADDYFTGLVDDIDEQAWQRIAHECALVATS